MHIFPVLLMYVLVSFCACVQGFTYGIALQNQGLSIAFEGHNVRKERDTHTVDQATMQYFLAFDGNGDKKVSAAEVTAAWKKLVGNGIVWSEEDILLTFDQDGDGELNVEEFQDWMKDGEILYYYKTMDHDSDGLLTRVEVLDFYKQWGMSEVSQSLAEDFAGADVNDDDRWDFAEFKAWLAVKGKEEDFIREDFNALDTDGNGFVSAVEHKNWSIRFGAIERVSWSNLFIMLYDLNQDGLLNFEEYANGLYGYVA